MPHVKRKTVLRPHSNIIITEDGRVGEYDCVHCVHCQMVMRVGEHRDQVFCYQCMGPVCHKLTCRSSCVPINQRLEERQRFAARLVT